MREKVNKLLNKKVYVIISLISILIFIIYEIININIDIYNFKQLEKVKSVLDSLDKNSYNFSNLKEFNKKFSQNIEPIKNCYFLSDRNRFFEKND
jgi:hypothetical protein